LPKIIVAGLEACDHLLTAIDRAAAALHDVRSAERVLGRLRRELDASAATACGEQATIALKTNAFVPKFTLASVRSHADWIFGR
jgi:hypothetical protein